PARQDNIIHTEFYFTYPALAVTPEALAFSSERSSPPAPKSLAISADGYSAKFTVSVKADGRWLSSTPLFGTTPASKPVAANVSVSVNPEELTPGTYKGVVTIAAPDADLTSAPRDVSVIYTVLPEKSDVRPKSHPKDKQDYVWVPPGRM